MMLVNTWSADYNNDDDNDYGDEDGDYVDDVMVLWCIYDDIQAKRFDSLCRATYIVVMDEGSKA